MSTTSNGLWTCECYDWQNLFLYALFIQIFPWSCLLCHKLECWNSYLLQLFFYLEKKKKIRNSSVALIVLHIMLSWIQFLSFFLRSGVFHFHILFWIQWISSLEREPWFHLERPTHISCAIWLHLPGRSIYAAASLYSWVNCWMQWNDRIW